MADAASAGCSVYDCQRFYLTIVVLLNQVLLFICALFVSLRLAQMQSGERWTQVIAAIAFSFASLPFGYAVTLNNHTPTAACLLLAFYLVVQIRHGCDQQAWRFLVAGLLVGLATSFELTAGIFALSFFALVLSTSWRKAVLFGLAALVPMVPTLAHYYVLTGVPLPIYMQTELYHFRGSYWNRPTAWDARHDPRWLYVFNATFGLRGLFSLSPILLLAPLGLYRGARDRAFLWRREYAAIAIGSLTVLVYILTTTNNYGGLALGMRWFLLFVPLWLVASVPTIESLGHSRGGRVLVYAMLVVSSAVVLEALVHQAFYGGGWPTGLLKLFGAA